MALLYLVLMVQVHIHPLPMGTRWIFLISLSAKNLTYFDRPNKRHFSFIIILCKMFIIISLQRIVFSFNRDSFFKSIFVWYFIKIAILTFSSNLGTFQHHFLAVSTLVRHIRIVLRYCYNITVQWRAWPLAVTKQKMSKVIGKVVRSN